MACLRFAGERDRERDLERERVGGLGDADLGPGECARGERRLVGEGDFDEDVFLVGKAGAFSSCAEVLCI